MTIEIGLKRENWFDRNAKKILLSLLAFSIIYSLGFVAFVQTLRFKNEDIGKADAIVVLTGAPGRIEAGLQMLKDGVAPKLFISGIENKIYLNQAVEKARINPKQVAFGTAKSTAENALETAEFAKRNNVRSMVVITSFYHMPRARALFNRYLKGVDITYVPISHQIRDSRNVFRNSIALSLAFKEYNKFLITGALTYFGADTAIKFL
ncbi:MAG: YdcF family protein [Alphaproteobacteria bacterium]|nr:YdcF family protein [Alphaproteobacteria bacterium]